MKIYSMTATFGKLENQTLTLEPGLNILHAPNEWGKSTWCAFLVAMLYGITTREHTTKTVLADKERYAPWSGSPMAGRIELNWNGRDITLERTTKGRSPLGVFRAYETHTGLDIPELTAENCGQQLLGVEKSVFTRAGFLKLSDLPVTQDDALRKRLNALVTTGDESGTADTLAQKLSDLKNKCYVNRSKGLLPQALAQKSALESKLEELQQLQSQSARIRQRQTELEQQHGLLINHKTALAYEANRVLSDKKAAAQTAQAAARLRVQELQSRCAELPEEDHLQQKLSQLQTLREAQDALHMEVQIRPQPPAKPDAPRPFLGLSPEVAQQQAAVNEEVYTQSKQEQERRLPGILGLILAAAGIAALLIPGWIGKALGCILILGGILLWSGNSATRRRATATVIALEQKYDPLPPGSWTAAANAFSDEQAAYTAQLQVYTDSQAALQQRSILLDEQLHALTDGGSASECRQRWQQALDDRKVLAEAQRELQRADALVQAFGNDHADAPLPAFPDTLTLDAQETARQLQDCEFEQRQLHQNLGHCQGSMAALGHENTLQRELDSLSQRIAQLEDIYAAVTLAQTTLSAAASELQRRFAPRISQRAQALFSQLTDGRYTRLTLDEELAVHAGAADEPTLHSALWRSEGTVDQLYLALRLAVAEELTPEAPLILDDALVRFDETRLHAALQILQQEAQTKQVLLFTCQERESRWAEQNLAFQ